MALFTETMTLFSLAATYIVFTFGRNMAFNNTLAVSVSTLPQEKKADSTAIFQMMQQFAGALGTAIASVLANSSQNLTEGVQRVFSLQRNRPITRYIEKGSKVLSTLEPFSIYILS